MKGPFRNGCEKSVEGRVERAEGRNSNLGGIQKEGERGERRCWNCLVEKKRKKKVQENLQEISSGGAAVKKEGRKGSRGGGGGRER